MKKIIAVLCIVLLGVILFRVVNLRRSVSNNAKLQVAASFYPMYFFVSQIGGDKADVFNITPASAEPHDYEPTTQDIARISDSNMLVLNGGSLEAWGTKIQDQLKGTNVLVVTAGEGLANKNIEEEGKTIIDPHVWQNPVLAKEQVIKIEKGFNMLDPKDSSYFQTNTKVLLTQLDELNLEFKKGLASCQKKDFVTSHAAFGYLASQYHINQVAISGVSPDEEPSTQKLGEISDFVKKENIKIIFFESLVSPKLSQTIAQETGAQTMVLDPIEGLTDNDLRSGKNYFSVMRQNLEALKTALVCTP